METTLFNKGGKPVAYIADDGETIYLWDGRAVAYLHNEKIYGFNGRQLGWFVNGTIFDVYGMRSGFTKSKSPIPTEAESTKTLKQAKPHLTERQHAVVKPPLCYGFSDKPLEKLLEDGKFH
jgi:hypothetical protein